MSMGKRTHRTFSGADCDGRTYVAITPHRAPIGVLSMFPRLTDNTRISQLRKHAESVSDYWITDLCGIALGDPDGAQVGPDGCDWTRGEARLECLRLYHADAGAYDGSEWAGRH